MIPAVIAFFLGVLFLYLFKTVPAISVVLIPIVFLTIFAVFWNQYFRKFKLYLVLVFCFGFFWVLFHAKMIIDKGLPEHLQHEPLTVIGTIHTIPETTDQGYRFEFEIDETIPTSLWPNPGRIRVHWYHANDKVPLQVGDKWQLSVKLKRPRSYANPGSFDLEKHLFQKRINAIGYVKDELPNQMMESSIWSHPMDRLRTKLRGKIHHYLENRPFAGIIPALVLGVQDGVSASQWKIFRETGTTHLAGLYVGLVTSFVFLMIRFIWRCLPRRFLRIPVPLAAAWAGLIVAFLYALLAGLSIPIQRAIVMIAAFIAGVLTKRSFSVWRSYCLALGIVLIGDPLSTLLPGFWLSFGAVGILLYGMRGRLDPKGIWWRFGRAQWVVFLGLTPITIAFFSITSFVSPLANIIAIPWLSFLVVPLALVGIFCSIFHDDIGSFFVKQAEYGVALLWPVLEQLSRIPKATSLNATHTPFLLCSGFMGALLLMTPRGFPVKYIGVIFLLPLFLVKSSTAVPFGKAYVTVLDVGQGLSVVIETAQHVLVFDTGPKLNTHMDTGERVVLPFLATRSRNKIDALLISHGDNDHMGGAHSILQKMKVNTIITSEPKLFPEYNTSTCYWGQRWEWDGVHFEMLHPEAHNTTKRNDHSCVLRVRAGKQSVLLTGDIEAKSEQKILQRSGNNIQSTVMLVPHHGSRSSSTLEFIQTINPTYAIIPVGYLNPYGHPKPEIVERYKQQGIILLDTIRHGAISFLLNDQEGAKTLRISDIYRIENKRYWHYTVASDFL